MSLSRRRRFGEKPTLLCDQSRFLLCLSLYIDSDNMEQFEQLLTCCVCLDRYRNPKLLPCQVWNNNINVKSVEIFKYFLIFVSIHFVWSHAWTVSVRFMNQSGCSPTQKYVMTENISCKPRESYETKQLAAVI